MRFQNLDLNLLVALNALLEDKSVSLAAERINLTQSATSNALRRLREYFNDELLVKKGRSMVLTPRGEEIAEPVRFVLDQISATIAVSQPFDPASSDRTLSIMASDYAMEVVLRPTMLAFEEEAPHMTFEIAALGDDVVEELKRGRADLLIALDTVVSTDLPFVELWEDDFVVVAWSGNRALRNGITRELYETLGHVVPRFGRTRIPSFEEWALKSHAIARHIEIITPNFTSMPTFVVGTQRIATMHRRLAERMARYLPIKIMEAPIEIPSIRPSAQWAPSSANDPALMWFVDRLKCHAAMPEA